MKARRSWYVLTLAALLAAESTAKPAAAAPARPQPATATS